MPQAGFAQNPDSFATQAVALENGSLKTSRYTIDFWGLRLPKIQDDLHGTKIKLFLDDAMGKKPIQCSVAKWRGKTATAQCITHAEKDLGMLLIQHGLAFADRSKIAGQPQEGAYISAEQDARQHSQGVWALVNPEPSIFNFDQLPDKQRQNLYIILAIVVGGPTLATLLLGFLMMASLNKMQRDVRKYINRYRVRDADIAKREKGVIAAALEGEMTANRAKIDAFVLIYKELLKNLKDPSQTPKYKTSGEIIHETPTLARSMYDQYHDKIGLFEPTLVKGLSEIYARVSDESEYTNLEPETPTAEAVSKVERVIKNAQALIPIMDKAVSGLQMVAKGHGPSTKG